ncbi:MULTISPECIES: cohesin domain-containing protein [Pseudoalteromonas]|uniref:Cohesin domain protein n=1 Tax=Pseudoalteromonas luteoviolacea (strain 2ta16) TaxID=1353533 RepID=V4HQP0_PSEL2|nr:MULTISPECIES: cohesin domain-containing protein [Pseudoalteromonas]ESP93150.1 Cohesin domain protein [Pseudoalteromonas luteoviolacea 2ta16]KZN37023.1 hypothetical protein N483_21495 [Pseudoalteromonas luteoviolacea NCIMB 1944]MCG7549951.1 cohesin domain-containing protein [Pseudoalteromonas sp. Of7M-16]
MKQLTMIFLLLNSLMVAASQGKAYLYSPELDIRAGSEFYVDIMLKDAPEVYGSQIALQFDTKQVTVLDKNEKEAAVQIEHGDFFDSARLYTLKNAVDLKTGTIDYIVSQVAPAKSVAGDGRVARVFFKANEATSTTNIELKQADFGTKQGEKYTFEIGESLQFNFDNTFADAPQAPADHSILLPITIVAGFVLLFAIVLFLKSKKGNTMANA